ncbi:MAG: epoxide hydrolase, partial [Jatrophihabitantaceae bacterium]|nr:epoxide hydrolase [Jatrophihabitantaceae bacterium]
ISIPDADLDDLADRIDRTRGPVDGPGAQWARGLPVQFVRDLAAYWRTEYDWRVHEARLNAFPQFTTFVDGQRVHFLHVRSPEPDATPLIVTHGWPGSIAEFLRVIGPLSDPRAHGGSPEDAFHLVIPSIPGFGFSGPVSEPGWDTARIGAAFAALMARLGYTRYGAQGGDWGSMISRWIGATDPERVVGVHVNMLSTPADAEALAPDASADEQERVAVNRRYTTDLSGYAQIQQSRPQTLAYGLNDSPVGQLAWIAEKFAEWTDSDDESLSAVDLDDMLTTVMIYWLTATAGSSAQIYYEVAHGPRARLVSPVPTAVAAFRHDLFRPIRRIAERHNVIEQWTEFDAGGHFAAMEQPEALVDDIRRFFRTLA